MTTIEKILILRKFIKQEGACIGINCVDCRLSLIGDLTIKSCKELHLAAESVKDPNLTTDINPDFVRVARERIVKILKQEAKKQI